MQKDDRKAKIKIIHQFGQSAFIGGTLWTIGFFARHLIHHQKRRQLGLNDIFTVSKTIKISAERELRSDVNYLVCDVDQATYTLMVLDQADYKPFLVTKKTIKRTVIRKDW